MRLQIFGLFSLALYVISALALTTGKTEYRPFIRSAFEKFKQDYNRTYETPEEEEYRLSLFNDFFWRMKAISDEANTDYVVGITKFADMTKDEIREKYISAVPESCAHSEAESEKEYTHLDTSNLSPSVDWEAAGAVTGISKQGLCADSHYLAAVVSLEAANFIKNGRLRKFSTQQIIDCSRPYKNYGCYGGTVENSLAYIEDNGIMDEDDYPYNHEDEFCQYNPSLVIYKPSGYRHVPFNDNDQLAAAVMQIPVATSIDALHDVFLGYKSGVITNTKCGKAVEHALGVVGYNMTANPPYFRLKNSYGRDWGEFGYVRILFQKGNKAQGICGICEKPLYAVP